MQEKEILKEQQTESLENTENMEQETNQQEPKPVEKIDETIETEKDQRIKELEQELETEKEKVKSLSNITIKREHVEPEETLEPYKPKIIR